MNSVEEVYRSGWPWLRKYSKTLQIGATISGNFLFLKNAGYSMEKTAMLSAVMLGGVTLLCFFSRQRKINARDLIVITGCNSGLGYSLAMHCRAQGAVVLGGMRKASASTASNSNTAVKALENKGVIVHHLDITNEQSTQDFREKIKKLLEERQLVLRALVNNAGVMTFGEFEWQTQDLAEYQINTNLLGTMRITRELMPILRKNNSRIIVISSHCADEPLPGISIYGATKAALHAWTTSLRVEISKYGVEVVSFVPGGFVTESNIMKRQRLHFDEMRKHMSDEAKQFYGNYFNRYAEYFSLDSIMKDEDNVKVLSDPKIYETFDNALLDIYPSTVYKCEPWRYFFYRILFKSTPRWIRDRLVQRFVVVPPWQPNE
ncbi:D-beta-hydroxybutyrate dehydrogenase, mitochondrial [Pogonomyrmex barbatus]|uniref:D-beta-hydroxybutyrate dehydrogenase, mitochondrial n=1 Tax=Pogonomyrmex barbatus TaxID=144034 RepID=A0A6I9WNF4_9HYME|nr:D-beta-hydroxybutyrate dehydrogenase, mitochondrial [Pogonomyrmex barbatus]XP_011643342.1 D-beta-hydroxybutyrate dehydrogenase, mitochondrial [Pogonomyrmex barbatus]XP_011643343.1 D-beta-hydroxybutyrate dehydrogenase, mitochondrial [Pogonomyrmex barbatus]XP_011643344.1 D-beta-hydroxybutyrate dehydrogenase, mitochondrial [Pogonomyrmex barbatus]XP_025075091.1 D-beta-hydroxybutyrate dehydrogenase, mitochondrial [Pogonomyrmex barbatus]